MKIEIQVLPKKGILDPQGKAVHHALENLGYSGLSEVRIGKLIQIEVKESNPPVTPATIKEMCEKLLANTVVEDYTFKII
ncbi:MAG: phosphoribosylformylglycinamidine synthase subunit PurS [Nitrospirae bacterium]|jgi:phosphoribosylformylglycinamidine synthase|nr:phosphoribosylformylglycinamidine synthase subunit PurS [Nitrospirota bacterium]